MNNINFKFYLRNDQVTKSGNYYIYVYFNLNGSKLYLSIGNNVPEKYWDTKFELVKRGYKDYVIINNKINNLKSEIIQTVQRADIEKQILTIKDIKQIFNKKTDTRDFVQ